VKISKSAYIAVKQVFEKWYGLTNDRANLQAMLEITDLVEKDINEQLANQAKG